MSRRTVSVIFFLLQSCLLLLMCLANQSQQRSHHHPCKRPCVTGSVPMTCHYDFVLETYASMGPYCRNCPHNLSDCFLPGCIPAEGLKKTLFVVNRQLPGPAIEVCQGDRIIVDLSNELMIETTTIHWHGHHQRDSPFMDGVPYVTQCPIPPDGRFRYNFTADYPGTYLWHSHSNEQRADGVFGSLVIRKPMDQEKQLAKLYDVDDHVLVLTEWTNALGVENYALTVHADLPKMPHTILVNGLGRYKPVLGPNGTKQHMPIAVFQVEQGLAYRFRLIHAGVQDCPLEISIDNHTMLVISTDGMDVDPIKVESVRILSGERFDVVVRADQAVDNFWIRIRGREGSGCVCDVTKAYQVAVLRYKGAPKSEPQSDVGYHIPPVNEMTQVNPYNKGMETPDALSIPTLNSLEPDDVTSQSPDHKFYLQYDYVNLDERNRLVKNFEKPDVESLKTAWQINHINLKLPNFPVLTQPELIQPGMFCNSETTKNCLEEYCSCTHVLSVKLNSTVELIFIDEGYRGFNHPIHLHGYNFRVVAMEKLGNTTTLEEVKKLDEEGKIKRKLNRAPFKDTVIIPSGGYTIVRFFADNPGYWLLHCHFELHADLGMGLIIKVGDHENFVKPPADFPKCGTYKPYM